MREKLLNKTVKIYLAFSAVILLVSAPVFFIFTEQWHIAEADEALLLRLHEFEKRHLPFLKQTDTAQWNFWNSDVKILSTDNALPAPAFSFEQFPNVMEDEKEPFRVLRSPIFIEQKPFVFFARENLLEREDLVYNLLALYVSLMFLLLLGLYFITHFYSAWLWRPFYEMLKQLESFEINKASSLVVSATNVDEFYRLHTEIEQLIDRNVAIYKSQKEFTENAAHELQTPLAVMQARLENLIQATYLSEKEANALESLGEAVSRLIRLNKNLLLLAKVENNAFPDRQKVSLKAYIEEQLAFLEDQEVMQGLEVHVELEVEGLVEVSPSLLEICISNLLNNAVRHNKPQGRLAILLKDKQLTVTNTGYYPELDTSKLFNRFAKVDPSSQGTGLGLAIVKKIVELYEWEISYSYQEGNHVFSLRW